VSLDLPRLSRALLCTIVGAAIVLPAAAQDNGFVSISGNTVNVRTQPTTRSDTAWELSKGYPLKVEQRRGKWLKVRDFEESLGWVFAPLTNKTPHRVVTVPTANLRAGPGPRHRVIGKLEQHEVVRTVGSQGEWAHVKRDGGQRGWVAKRLTWGW
jgi:SH3-like domain-containing protein